ncbi:prostamide/prostaglandin F synthase-like isoform X2 [Labrus bergylta]|uniref:prostamide/prostaglandin F synthase-like isoform X2 n=1 Tax=Labrus bergylta TaxID=56723 RepID=UPI003313BA0B
MSLLYSYTDSTLSSATHRDKLLASVLCFYCQFVCSKEKGCRGPVEKKHSPCNSAGCFAGLSGIRMQVQWDAFLQHLDDELQLAAQTLDDTEQIKCISPDTSLIDARTGEKVTLEKYFGRGQKILLVLIRQFSCLLCRLHLKELEKHQRSLDSHSIQVLVISFGCQEGASHWLKETGCQYDMLLDSDRKMYTAFGLGASLKKVLSFSNMLLYAEYVVDNMEFPRGLPSIQDDMFQLGGDFVVDEHGRVLFSYCCQSPIDRPSVEEILSGQ